MNNLPLQPLVWDWANAKDKDTNAICRAKSPSHEYIVRMNAGGEVYVDYYKFDNSEGENNRKDEPPVFDSISAAQEWAQSTHYSRKMQPYVKPTPSKVYELTYDYGDGYSTLFMTLDKQLAVDFMDSVKKHDEQFICDTSYDEYEVETIHDLYNDNHPLAPYKDKIFNSIYEDSFSEWMLNYGSNSFVSSLDIIEHELFSTIQNNKGDCP